MELYSKFKQKNIFEKKKSRLKNVGHFVLASMSQSEPFDYM